MPALGILTPQRTPTPEQRARGAFAQKLRKLGWIEGQNLKVERAWVMSPEAVRTAGQQNLVETASRDLGFQLAVYVVQGADEFDTAFASMIAARTQAIALTGNPLTWRERKRIVEFANRNRLPSAFGMKDFVQVGGLLSYGPDTNDTIRQSVVYVDRILRGARPADLPIEQPKKYELTIGRGTARALGLTIPASALARADEVISYHVMVSFGTIVDARPGSLSPGRSD